MSEPVAWMPPSALAWGKIESEKVVKLTRKAQPKYGYTAPLYATPPDHRAVMQQALEALESCAVLIDSEWGSCRTLDDMNADSDFPALVKGPIRALRAALGEVDE